MSTHLCLRTNSHLCLILKHWSFAKAKNILDTFNVCKSPAKEDQLVDRWDADEIEMKGIVFYKYLQCLPLILRNSKKLNMAKIVIFTISYFWTAQHV